MHTLICGSLAFDTIMVFQDQFKNHILPDKIHKLSVAFYVPEMRREFGGTAGNIAYNLQLLDGNPLIMATAGEDFSPYAQWLTKHQLNTTHIKIVPDTFTAQAYITTDIDDNQITAFHPGAMTQSHQNSVNEAINVSLAIIAPDGRDGMFQHARECFEAGIPFMFDPGQGLPMFNGEELLYFIEMADYLAVNDYESQIIQDKTGLSLEELAQKVTALIVTLGASGSHIYADGQRYEIPCVQAQQIVDPTGCGDAYRAGLLYGIAHGWDWPTCGRLASTMGSIKIGSRGGQNHKPTRDDIEAIYTQALLSEVVAKEAI
ncbi:MAG: carbohydrate kinase family protein [Methylotenera sp. 24-45-7]|jgi:adenosine kinase|nr:MAG: carbohydrate kinase family protein [Mehylophilales bacterium 35-46-6]OYZ40800.1 MAG: carbohydrate kinase family protein [Methylotenera sp. 24-45-7]OZA53734.1 MAG: carbohydrate kinase family protein [Methylophilales bacterium 39-45-7]HQS37579.1 carbohydrate kinase family protein [Methylotenera sp.]HQS44101.1 carbohydrate kinase family protein [Methylotenera sp.]